MLRCAGFLVLLCGLLVSGAPLVCAAEQEHEGSPQPQTATLGPDGVQRATIVLDSYRYEPAYLIVLSNRPVELTLTSVTTLTPHNFVLNEGGLALNVDVSAGKTVVLKFSPPPIGTFAFYCDKQLLFFKSHREKGMEGRLEVRP